MRLWQILLLVIGTVSAYESYEGYQIFDLVAQDTAQLNSLRTFTSKNYERYDILQMSKLAGKPIRLMVNAEEITNFKSFLQAQNINYNISNKNVGETMQQDISLNQLLRQLMPYNSTRPRLSTERYYSHEEINAYIEDLAKRFPQRAFLKTWGKSYENRLLKTLTITNGDGRAGKNVILMDGGFHAREWISPAAVIYAIEQLVENFAQNAELLQDYDWLVLPVVNPDGYEYTQLSADTRSWRKTRQPLQQNEQICIGTDPNRNFDFHWNEEGSSSDACSIIFSGPKPFSEREAAVVRDLIHTLRGRGIMYLTVHSCGELILYPWGWTSDMPDTWPDLHEVAVAGQSAIREATGTEYTVGSSTNVLYVAAGASDDYAFNEGFPISFTMELPCGGPNLFDPPPSDIDRLVKETWVGIRAMAAKVVEKYPLNK